MGDETSRVFHTVSEIWCGTDRQKTDGCSNQNRRLSH